MRKIIFTNIFLFLIICFVQAEDLFPLHEAVMEKNEYKVWELIKTGYEINTKNKEGTNLFWGQCQCTEQ